MRFSEWVKIGKPFFVWVPAGLWGFSILFLSLLPCNVEASLPVDHLDKIFHFAAYAVLTFLYMWGVKRSHRSLTAKNIAFALILTTCYGILIEIFQGFVPGREPSFYDALANSGGVITGICFGRLVLWRK